MTKKDDWTFALLLTAGFGVWYLMSKSRATAAADSAAAAAAVNQGGPAGPMINPRTGLPF